VLDTLLIALTEPESARIAALRLGRLKRFDVTPTERAAA